jgi:hypothetical protein
MLCRPSPTLCFDEALGLGQLHLDGGGLMLLSASSGVNGGAHRFRSLALFSMGAKQVGDDQLRQAMHEGEQSRVYAGG